MKTSSVYDLKVFDNTQADNKNNVIDLQQTRNIRRQQKRYKLNILKQRLVGLLLLVLSVIAWRLTMDLTVMLFLSPIFLTMLCSKKYVMLFKE